MPFHPKSSSSYPGILLPLTARARRCLLEGKPELQPKVLFDLSREHQALFVESDGGI